MTVVPGATGVMRPSDPTVATAGLSDEYVNAPGLVDDGAVMATGALPYAMFDTVNDPRTGVARFTTKVVAVELASNKSVAGCDAVIVVVPAETSVIAPVVAFTVATAGLLDVYVNGAVFVEAGGVIGAIGEATETVDSENAPYVGSAF